MKRDFDTSYGSINSFSVNNHETYVPLHVVIISFFLTVTIPELKYTVVYSHITNIWVFLYFTSKVFLMKGFHNKNSKTIRENENIENRI